MKWLTCEAISHRSWPLCSVPSAAWSKSGALCKGSPTPTRSQYTSEPKILEHIQVCFTTPTEMFWNIWRKLASLHRWGFLWSACGGSLWRLPRCCSFPARQSPAPPPCPGQSGHSPSPGALFPQYPPPAGRQSGRNITERHKNEAPSTVQQLCREKISVLTVVLPIDVITSVEQQEAQNTYSHLIWGMLQSPSYERITSGGQ